MRLNKTQYRDNKLVTRWHMRQIKYIRTHLTVTFGKVPREIIAILDTYGDTTFRDLMDTIKCAKQTLITAIRKLRTHDIVRRRKFGDGVFRYYLMKGNLEVHQQWIQEIYDGLEIKYSSKKDIEL